ncbi:MAG: ABC transporter permease [bacterium]|jgi:simple sugar transport system permease protein|nr:ABC transporter permease [bacterium]
MKKSLLFPLSILAAFAALSLFLWLNDYAPLAVFQTIFSNSWQTASGQLSMLTKASLLILTGLAVAIPYRAGLFNIGGEGQMLMGGLAAVLAGIYTPTLFGKAALLFSLAAGLAGGIAWAVISAYLKTRHQIHEVISTIMLNFIALQIANECALNFFSAGEGTSRTPMIPDNARLPVLFAFRSADTTWGIVLAVLVALGLAWLLYKTWLGYRLRAVGSNPVASAYAGISPGTAHAWAMGLGGACAGLAGAIQTCGIDHTYYARFSSGFGFDGIAVAFLGMNEPWAMIPAALVIATLRASDRALQLDLGIPKDMVMVLEGMIIICVAIFMRRKAHD